MPQMRLINGRRQRRDRRKTGQERGGWVWEEMGEREVRARYVRRLSGGSEGGDGVVDRAAVAATEEIQQAGRDRCMG
ncbi:hypothetical protein L484_014442 [Morus notabilis]|uniref:Uncharacterized protein n=1 Tax=Morus notabilis TaxID=981085 RepID=W9QUD5_9ROSA|nr:hypothetical protein L484_014442 [Morus notabilis]